MDGGRALLKLDSRWWRERYSGNLGREKEIKRFNKLGEGEKEGGAYHPSALPLLNAVQAVQDYSRDPLTI